MDKGDKTDESNLDHVLKLFRQKGYLVAHRLVTPEKAGVPMSRQRFHFQLVRVAAAADEEAAGLWLKDLETAWDAILEWSYAPLPLDNFLLDEQAVDFQGHAQGARSCSHRATKAEEKATPVWKAMHEQMFKDHEAMLYHVVASLRSCFLIVINHDFEELALLARSVCSRFSPR